MAGDRHGKHNTTTISFRDHAFTIMYVLLERKKQLRLSGQK